MKRLLIFIFITIVFLIANNIFLKAATTSTNEQIYIKDAHIYPNPFNNREEVAKITFTIVNEVTLDSPKAYAVVYNYNGKKVWTKEKDLGNLTKGENKIIIRWGGENDLGDKVSKGLYFIKVIVESNNTVYKIIKVMVK